LTTWVDHELVSTREKVKDEVERQYNPNTCDADRLNFLSQLTGFTGEYWDDFYTENQKRLLITNSLSSLWPERGRVECISQVLSILGVLHIIREKGSFILGESVLGDVLGFVGWQFVVILPNAYFGSLQEAAVEKAIRLLTPCWCTSEIIYDDRYFTPIELLSLDGISGIFAEPDAIIKVR
jgi:hypothetical protein